MLKFVIYRKSQKKLSTIPHKKACRKRKMLCAKGGQNTRRAKKEGFCGEFSTRWTTFVHNNKAVFVVLSGNSVFFGEKQKRKD